MDYMAAQMDRQIEGAQVTREALELDAERYRYLRENFASVGMDGVELLWDQPDPCDALDSLVDSAIARRPAVGAA